MRAISSAEPSEARRKGGGPPTLLEHAAASATCGVDHGGQRAQDLPVLTFRLTLGRPEQFAHSRDAAGFLGLRPNVVRQAGLEF